MGELDIECVAEGLGILEKSPIFRENHNTAIPFFRCFFGLIKMTEAELRC